MPFLSTGIDVRTVNLSHLLNPDWSIQIFPAPAVCKAKKYTVNQGCMSLCQPVIWSMAAMLHDSVVVVVRTRPRAIPLAMITVRKSTHGFPFVFHIWDAYGAPLCGPSGRRSSAIMLKIMPAYNVILLWMFKILFSCGWPIVIAELGRPEGPPSGAP